MFGLLSTWSLATARYGGPDEPAHVLRAASVAHGELVGSVVPELAPGFRAVNVPGELATGDPACFRHDPHVPATCAMAQPAGAVRRAATSAGTYPPLYYAMVGLPVRLIGNVAQVQRYRFVAAFWCALVLATALRRSRRLPSGALVLAALSPASWFLFGVVNPNALEIALVLLAWVGVVRIGKSPSPSLSPSPALSLSLSPPRSPSFNDLLWFSVPAGFAIMIRPIAALPWLIMTGVLYHGRNLGGAFASKRESWLRRIGLFAAPLGAAVSVLAWNWWSDQRLTDPRTASTLSYGASMLRSARESIDTLRELAGSLGWLEFSAPVWTQVLWWLVVASAGYMMWRRDARSVRRWFALLALVFVSPVVFETFFAHRIGFVWQGRYSIPTAIGLVVLSMRLELPRTVLGVPSAWAIAATVFAIEIGTYWYTLRRYTVGIDGSWLFRRASWHPPVGSFVLVALNAALIASLLAMHQRTSTVRRYIAEICVSDCPR